MARYTVQGEPYFDGSSLHKPGELVTLPDKGAHSAPVPGWLKEDGTPVKMAEVKARRAEHRKAMDALVNGDDEDEPTGKTPTK